MAEPQVSSTPVEVMAAVDLGSNSFHRVVARAQDGGPPIIVDRLREMVRLAAGLSPHGYLDDESQDRALGCLRKFGQRLRDMDAHRVRVVGTNTLRRARNAEQFLLAAEEALGHPVEVISGMEEARLIYLGVSHHMDKTEGNNLVIDIGGGSTELIVGEGYEPRHLESLAIGCVELSQLHFGNGKLSQKRFDRARLAVRLELRPIVSKFRRFGWVRAIGSSGTVRAVGEIAHELGLVERGISLAAAEQMIEQMIAARRLEALQLPGLNPDRAPVLPGGIAILAEFMQSHGVEQMEISDGALREGLLYDMLGRLHDEDARERTIRSLERRYQIDVEQAARVEGTAAQLLAKVERSWQLNDERYRQLLRWAARLHEIGLDIAHSKYHVHGAYLLANADLPGFVRLEQKLLATLVGFHRRKLDGLALEQLPAPWRSPMLKLIVLLRLAALLSRTRGPVELPPLELFPRNGLLELTFPAVWLERNPLTAADLEQERAWLQARDFDLRITAAGEPEIPQEASAS